MFKARDGHVARALTIAGSDSGGGAGVQADLKTMHQFGVYGTSVITALTAQNTRGVQGVCDVPAAFVKSQFASITDDIGTDAVKTGMLASAEIIREVAEFLSHHAMPLVVDPVMVAKGGAPLLQPDAIDTLKHGLLKIATVVTPNLSEAEALCGSELRDWAVLHQAARDIAGFGPKYVVLKGGHAPYADGKSEDGQDAFVFDTAQFATDIVYTADTDEFTYLVTPRIDSRKTHGTGCTYSAAITALLARGEDPLSAIAGAKIFVYHAIDRACNWDIGFGHGPTDHSAPANPTRRPEVGKFNLYRAGAWTVR